MLNLSAFFKIEMYVGQHIDLKVYSKQFVDEA